MFAPCTSLILSHTFSVHDAHYERKMLGTNYLKVKFHSKKSCVFLHRNFPDLRYSCNLYVVLLKYVSRVQVTTGLGFFLCLNHLCDSEDCESLLSQALPS